MQRYKAKFKNDFQRRAYKFALDVIEFVVRGFGLVLGQYQTSKIKGQNDKAKVEQISKCKMQNDKAKFKNGLQRRIYRFAPNVIEFVV